MSGDAMKIRRMHELCGELVEQGFGDDDAIVILHGDQLAVEAGWLMGRAGWVIRDMHTNSDAEDPWTTWVAYEQGYLPPEDGRTCPCKVVAARAREAEGR